MWEWHNYFLVKIKHSIINLCKTKSNPEFNFQYIIDIFSNKTLNAQITNNTQSSSSKGIKFNLSDIELDDLNLNYLDNALTLLSKSQKEEQNLLLSSHNGIK